MTIYLVERPDLPDTTELFVWQNGKDVDTTTPQYLDILQRAAAHIINHEEKTSQTTLVECWMCHKKVLIADLFSNDSNHPTCSLACFDDLQRHYGD